MLYSGIYAAAYTPWKKIEKFDDGTTFTATTWETWDWVALSIFITILLIELFLAVWAVYLSWTSNSLVGWNVFAKIFFAFFALLFGLNYLCIHLFNKWDLTSHIRTQNARISALEYPTLAPVVTGGRGKGKGRT